MSVKIMSLVWELDLPPNEKFVLLAYADHADQDGRNIYPAIQTIAWKCGYSERSVQYITRKLEEKGLLVDDGAGPKGKNKWRFRGAKFSGVQKGVQDDASGVQPIAPRGVQKGVQKGVQPTAPKPITGKGHGKPSVEAVEERSSSAAAFSSFNENAGTSKARALLITASTYVHLPDGFEEKVEAVYQMIAAYGEARTIDALKVARDKWAATKGKGGRLYSPGNPAWVDWATRYMAGDTPWQEEVIGPEYKRFIPPREETYVPPEEDRKKLREQLRKAAETSRQVLGLASRFDPGADG